MKPFTITVENNKRKQVFTQEYASDRYARLSLYHVMSDMLDRAIKESFVDKSKEYEESARKFNDGDMVDNAKKPDIDDRV